MKPRLLISLCVFLTSAFAPSSNAGAAEQPVQRPTGAGPLAYSVPEATPYQSKQVVVHYVATGEDAPPLNDDDQNGVPDYIERIGAAPRPAVRSYSSRRT
jgi:hypothetical protein